MDSEPATALDHPADAGSAPFGAPAGGVPEVVVQVLGPVGVLGADRPFARAWTLDLVIYLAMHPEGVGQDVWPAALWPDRVAAGPTRNSTVSAARRALGRSATGGDHLPRCSGRLRLARSVTSDWERFRQLAGVEGPAGPAAWHAALDLVRGRPFDGLRAADWTVLEGIEAHVQDSVVQLALRLAGHRLDQGDGRGAELAARRGLAASAYDERLYRVLLEAADRQGNPGGVESAMDELLTVVGGDRPRRRPAEPLDAGALAWVHPDTVAAYRAFSRCRRGRTRAVPQPA